MGPSRPEIRGDRQRGRGRGREEEAEAAPRGPGPPRGRRGAGSPAFPSPGGGPHPGTGPPSRGPLSSRRTHTPGKPPALCPFARAPPPRALTSADARHPPHLHATPRPLPRGRPFPSGGPQPPHLPAPRPRTLGSRRAEPALGPAPRRSHFLVGGGRGLPASAPRGRGRRPGWRPPDPRPRPPIRGGGCAAPRRPETVRDRPSQLNGWGN